MKNLKLFQKINESKPKFSAYENEYLSEFQMKVKLNE